jgi:OOP family OmpA-OmpF porin
MQRPHVLFFLAFAATAFTGAARADNVSGPYGEIAGGGSHSREMDFGDAGGTVEFESGGLGVLSLGYATMSGLRPELEVSFRRNDAESSGSEEARTAMANLWYDFRAPAFAPRVRPYLGAGIGSADVEIDQLVDRNGASRSASDTVTAYQGGAGLNYDATRNLVLSLGYRYLETDEIVFAGTPGTEGDVLNPGTPGTDATAEHYRNDGVLAGLRYVFGRSERPPMAAAPAPAEVAALETVTLRPVNFQFDKADLTEPSKATLDEIAQRLAATEMKITIEGYTDDQGSDRYNQQLGERRAQAVRDYLASKGVPAENVEIASRGEADPVADNATPEGRAHNRRAEVRTPERPGDVKIVIKGPTEESVDAASEEDPR